MAVPELLHKLRFPAVFGACLIGINYLWRHRGEYVHEGREERQLDAHRKSAETRRQLAEKLNK